MSMQCHIYRSGKKDQMYLYVNSPEQSDDFDPLALLPEGLRQVFGRAEFVMQLLLQPERKLARVNVLHVMDALQSKGFFIQMPPEGFINPLAEPEGLRGA